MSLFRRVLVAMILTCLAILIPGVLAGAVYLALYSRSAGPHASGSLVWLLIAGPFVTALPAGAFAFFLAPVVAWSLSANWPRSRTRWLAAGWAALLFFMLANLFIFSIPNEVAWNSGSENYDIPLAPRPLISVSELPLLAISILSALYAESVCRRVVRDGVGGLRSAPSPAAPPPPAA